MSEAKAPSLSTRQARALALIAAGWTFPEIGSRLKIAPRVVLLYLVHLQRYLGTRTPGELTQVLLQARLIPMEWAKAQTRRLRRPKAPPAASPAVPGLAPKAGGGTAPA
jgi:DNA-binding CsgD family transcriptional regulator